MKLWLLFYNGWIHFRKKTASCCDALPAYRIARILSLLFFIFIFLKLSWFFSPQQSIALPFTTWNHSTDGVTSNRAHPHFHSAFWSAHFPVVLKQWACLLLLPLDTSLSLPRDYHLQLLKKARNKQLLSVRCSYFLSNKNWPFWDRKILTLLLGY